ncbi:MAG: hypothetical protein ACRDIE_15570, partial [Chloroflexota bacterium]
MITPDPPLPPPAWARTAAALACAALVPLGVLLMQQTYSLGWLPTLPYGILGDIFPNPEWVLYGTICVLLGCLGVFFTLPPLLPSTDVVVDAIGPR